MPRQRYISPKQHKETWLPCSEGDESVSCVQNGYTPLHQAAQQGNTHIINVLLQYGAKPNATTAVSTWPHTQTDIYTHAAD